MSSIFDKIRESSNLAKGGMIFLFSAAIVTAIAVPTAMAHKEVTGNFARKVNMYWNSDDGLSYSGAYLDRDEESAINSELRHQVEDLELEYLSIELSISYEYVGKSPFATDAYYIEYNRYQETETDFTSESQSFATVKLEDNTSVNIDTNQWTNVNDPDSTEVATQATGEYEYLMFFTGAVETSSETNIVSHLSLIDENETEITSDEYYDFDSSLGDKQYYFTIEKDELTVEQTVLNLSPKNIDVMLDIV